MSARVLPFPTPAARPAPALELEPDALFFVVRDTDGFYLGRETVDGPLTFAPYRFAYAYPGDVAEQITRRRAGCRMVPA